MSAEDCDTLSVSYQVNQFPEVNSENSITFLQKMLSFRITKLTGTADLIRRNIILNAQNRNGQITVDVSTAGVGYRVRYGVDYSTSTNLTLGANTKEMEITLPSECNPISSSNPTTAPTEEGK